MPQDVQTEIKGVRASDRRLNSHVFKPANVARTPFMLPDLHSPRLRNSLILAALTTLVVCAPVWPGLMSFDSLIAYRQSISGVETAFWPPMHDYLFYISRKLTGGPGGLFAGQLFVLFASAGAIIGMFARTSRRHTLGFVVFAVSFFWFPTMLGTAIVNWKDVSLATFSLLALACWLGAIRASSPWLLGVAAISIGVAVAVRINGLALMLPFVALVLLYPIAKPTPLARALAAIAMVVCLLAAQATGVWRLPDFRRLPPATSLFATLQLWDLVGTSACVGENLFPPSFDGPEALTVPQLRAIYDPRHINLTMTPPAGVKPLNTPAGEVPRDVGIAWTSAVRHHPGCYLRHRAHILVNQLGMTRHVFYPTHGGIDDNPYGISFRHPAAASRVIDFVRAGADSWLRRPFWLLLLAIAAMVTALRRGPEFGAIALVLGVGSALYLASFFFLSPAADARYIFPVNVFCALLSVLALVALRQEGEFQSNAPLADPSRDTGRGS